LSFAGRILSSVVSMTMLLFSSYEGNNARFSDVFIGHDNQIVRIRTSLLYAFDNDFEQIFRSGSPININYYLIVSRDGILLDSIEYRNTVIYDPMERFFRIEAEVSNNFTFTVSCDDLRTIISEVDIFYDHWGIGGTYKFELSASMERVTLESLEREFDLMMLWNYKTPKIVFEYKVELYES